MDESSNDLDRFRLRLRRALVCAPALALAIPLGCTNGGSKVAKTSDAKLADAGKGSKDKNGEDIDAPTTAIDPDEIEHLPSCPSGEWCGTKALAEPLEAADFEGKTLDVEGCPKNIQAKELGVDVDTSAYEGLPLYSGVYARLDLESTKAKRSAGEQDACCYDWMEDCPGGRPLLDDGRPQLAQLRPAAKGSTPWSATLDELDRDAIAKLPTATRQAIAEAWLADALMEHSSIASFARTQLELEAVGAPEALIRGCERAAVDERRHARLCFGLAAAYGDATLEPESLPEHPPRLAGLTRVAIDTFIEGCVGETIAAACVRRAARGAQDPALAQILNEIADDEGEHAALAWQTLAWAIERGGAPVYQAVVETAASLRPDPGDASERSTVTRDALAGHGQLARELRGQLRRDVWVTIIDPLLAELTRV